ncbi:MAG TPA: tripartite tricarboxylate transporter substrate binding protein [Burkholderiales bacterium]|nr:tripartite tricarboxylate transporter substrate binding protein [Burkholderiales bacterium]
MRSALPRTLLALAIAASLAASSAHAASGQPAYPARPVRFVVPFTAGSATDIMARVITARLAERWGQPVVVENRPSAGGIVAGRIVAEATPDGHTLMAIGSAFAGSAALYSKLPYDPVKDFAGITQTATTPLVLVVSPALGVKSVAELVALAKHKPGQVNFATTGLGSGPHYATELFKLVAGIEAVHVPYRGSPEALTDTISGRVQFFMSPILAAMPLIKGGRVQALGVTTRERAPSLPEVPTIAEAGVPGYEYQGWYGLLAPGKTPRAIIGWLAREVHGVLELAEVRERIATQGAAAKVSTPEAFDRLIHEEIATRRKVWRAAGVKVE